jgi:hypothetical protein
MQVASEPVRASTLHGFAACGRPTRLPAELRPYLFGLVRVRAFVVRACVRACVRVSARPATAQLYVRCGNLTAHLRPRSSCARVASCRETCARLSGTAKNWRRRSVPSTPTRMCTGKRRGSRRQPARGQTRVPPSAGIRKRASDLSGAGERARASCVCWTDAQETILKS